MNCKFATVNMVSFCIHHKVFRIEAGVFRERREIQNPNLDCWQSSAVVIALVEVVK